MSNKNDVSAEVVFEYTGKGCCSVPRNVTIVRFHPSVAEVEEEAFMNCKQLRVVIFNDGLKKIGTCAFWYCTSLSSITLPSTVTEIGSNAFHYCNNLREVIFKEGLQEIRFGAFRYCKSLESVTLPSTVAEVNDRAFADCNSLREVVFHGVPREIGQDAFRTCHGVSRDIGQDAFRYCTSLEKFTFPTISTRLDTLIQTGHWEEIENEVDEVRGVVIRSGGNLFASTQTMGGGINLSAVRKDIDKISRLISYYELKEATSLVELALWKFKLDQVD